MSGPVSSTTSATLLAVVFVRDGVVPSGGDEVVAECSGRVVLCGTGTQQATGGLNANAVYTLELSTTGLRPAELVHALLSVEPVATAVRNASVLVLPGSPDGRDVAPRLAHALGRPLLAGAIQVNEHTAWVARAGGQEIHEVAIEHSSGHGFVATLVPGTRGVAPADASTSQAVGAHATASGPTSGAVTDCDVIEVLGPDVTTMDLTEAPRILGGGAGLDSSERFDVLTEIATALGASVGATRVVTDRGWLPHQRQIGTTGCVINPELYLAFGISGAVQHTAGLGQPAHIVSVNTDPHCPMMQLADLAIVSDANLVLDELRTRVAAVRS